MSRLEPTRSQAFVIANVSDAPREVSRTTRTGELLGLVAPLAANLRGLRAQHEVLPPGRRSAPPHAHSTREELLFVVEGIPELWMDGAFHPLRPGDVVSFTAGTGIAHAIVNRSDRDAVLFVVATMPADDVCSYTSEG